MLEKAESITSPNKEASHVENIEQSGPISGSQMLVDNAGVHHRHSIAGKFDDFSPLCFVFLKKYSSFEFTHVSQNLLMILLLFILVIDLGKTSF